MTKLALNLPKHFRFGAATAAYQIEGAANTDGRGPSVWDDFSHLPGRILDGSSGDVACDHYNRMPEDVELMRQLGLDAYRFSISWSRVLPDGVGTVNAAGLDFYDRLVDALCAAGIDPMATVFHWDLPLALQDRGGWLNRDITGWISEYTQVIAERLGDRVTDWAPLNEPNYHLNFGHALGAAAPGIRLGLGAVPVAHHINLAHAAVVQTLRAAGAKSVGAATNHVNVVPATDSAEDRLAAEFCDAYTHRVFADPMLLGTYPKELHHLLSDQMLAEAADIKQPLDFYGFNYYEPLRVAAPGSEAARTEGEPIPLFAPITGMPFEKVRYETVSRTASDWAIDPNGLKATIAGLRARYPDLPPLAITENGANFADVITADGGVHDTERIDYIGRHLAAVSECIADGADIRSYYVWSLLDNYEWIFGYGPRFGIIHVDYDTQVRTPKDSYHWYRQLIAEHHQAHSA